MEQKIDKEIFKVLCYKTLYDVYGKKIPILIEGKMYDAKDSALNSIYRTDRYLFINGEEGWKNIDYAKDYVVIASEWRDQQIDKILE
jgi:hypothetical protein